ncbi:MAG: DNA mismatch repair endonuclease MutL [Chlamydiales bacterium]|nr:DNA mismatch repair endonuclease MutL [Chlamydiales bacterium]
MTCMAARIRVLTEDTINKIAAGEVVENSASVIKELVENSLDAGSTEIFVEIKGGGRQLIRVTDNGHGMHQDDALLCLERHATSKIRQAEDLEQIGTLGFRGEAIPTIAAISKFTLLTCPSESSSEEATMVIVDGGKISTCCSAVRQPGTTIEVKNLFFNVPARRKFQKSPAHDANEVLKTLSNLALAYPKITFELISDQESLLKTRGTEDLAERVRAVLGNEFFEQCTKVSHEHEGCRLEGFVGLPIYSRPNRTGQHLFINGRAVISPLIAHLVREAYGTALPTNRYPLFALQLTVPGDFVDVNVHPQKREVRLRQNDFFRELMLRGVGKALQQSAHTLTAPDVNFFAPNPVPLSPLLAPLPWEEAPPEPELIIREIPQPTFTSSAPNNTLFATKVAAPRAVAVIRGYIILDPASCTHMLNGVDATLLLLDQRAAHHRILFERLQHHSSPHIQPLLIPLTVEFSTVEAACIREVTSQLRSLGLEIEEFGQNTFLVRAVPAELEASDASTLLSELVEQLRQFSSDSVRSLEKEKRLSLIASRLAVRRKRHLNLPEAQHLIEELFKCDSPLQCPQGYPTLLALSDRDLAKQFLK